MSASDAAARRHGWLDLLQQNGPFVTLPVADRVWPAGLPTVPAPVRAQLRFTMTELLDGGMSQAELAQAVLVDTLGWADALKEGPGIPAAMTEVVAENGVVLRPDFGFYAEPDDTNDDDADGQPDDDHDDDDDEGQDDLASQPSPPAVNDNPWRLLGMWLPRGQHPLARSVEAGWTASPVERLAALLRARDVPVGLVGDGRWWALVWAPRGKPVGSAVWDAGLWSEEPETLQAFVALLERRRFLGVAAPDRLPALLEESAQAQEEVTTALGGQVRHAVGMLVVRLDELDLQAERELLRDVSDDDLYAGVVTVMMRLVFLLFAEDAGCCPVTMPSTTTVTRSVAWSNSSNAGQQSLASRPSNTEPEPGTVCSRSAAPCTVASPTRIYASPRTGVACSTRTATPGWKVPPALRPRWTTSRCCACSKPCSTSDSTANAAA